MISPRIAPKKAGVLFLVAAVLLLTACASHLKEAKSHYAEGQRFSRIYQREQALSFYKKALKEAELEATQHPSAQAYLVKGLAELNLELWKKAEDSFREAFSLGFDRGEEWAEEASLIGLASTLQEMGLEEAASKIYLLLMDRSKFQPVTVLAAQRYMDVVLKSMLKQDDKNKRAQLTGLLRKAEKLSEKDYGCGFYHYLESQVLSHLGEYRRSFEEAVIARELGLPSQEILHDNDLQVVFCGKKLREELYGEEWKKFQSVYYKWVEKWNWQDPETPDWKKR